MINKLIVLIITRIIELAVLYFLVSFIWNAAQTPAIQIGFIATAVTAYCIYLGVTVSNDYRELKFGEGEPMQ